MFVVALALAAPPPVVGGQPAPPGRWPDAVAVFNDNGFLCTGTLIAPRLVLTAGHCIALVTHVVVGADDHAVDGEVIDVVWSAEHPDSFATLDVGLLELATPATQAPRALLTDCLADFLIDGATATVAGFGRIDASGQERTTRLMDATVPIVDADCSDLSRGCRSLVSPGGELIAGGDGVDTCTGDSGGPLYVETPDGQTYLAGVVSRGAYPASVTCGDGGVYVRADAARDWIEVEGRIELARPSCAGLNRPPRVTTDVLRVTQGRAAPLPIAIDDPEGEAVDVRVLSGPARGRVDADLVFRAEPFQVGPDRVVLEITDRGEPPHRQVVAIDIAVSPAGHLPDAIAALPRGCDTSGGALGWAALGILFARRRRHQTLPGVPVYRR